MSGLNSIGVRSSVGLPPLRACEVRKRIILYGANLPMLLKLAKSRQMPVAEAVSGAKEAGRKYINSYDLSASSGPARAAS